MNNVNNEIVGENPPATNGRPAPRGEPRSVRIFRPKSGKARKPFPSSKPIDCDHTEVISDPLSDKIFLPHEDVMSTVPGEKNIYPGADGLSELTRTEYEYIAAHIHDSKRRIPRSGYAYYAACLTWARLLSLERSNGGAINYFEEQFIKQCEYFKPPKLLGLFLAGFGNTKFKSGFHHFRVRLKRPRYHYVREFNGLRGFFGPIRNNPGAYASYPSLAVFARRMMVDIQATALGVDEIPWNLPPPFNNHGHLLTLSCLGYEPGRPLSAIATNCMSECGISQDDFHTDNNHLAFNLQYLREVQTWLDESGINVVPFPTHLHGSQAQLMMSAVFTANDAASILDADWESECSEILPTIVEYAGGAFRYRVDKNPRGVGRLAIRRILMPYEIELDADYPHALMNFLRVGETDGMLTLVNGISPPFVCLQRLRSMVSADTKPP